MALDKLKHQYTDPLQVSSLSVDGKLSIGGTVFVNGSPGAAGYLLTSTATGVQWAPVLAGAQGVQGTQGLQGLQGTQGLQGPTNTTYTAPTLGATSIPSGATVLTIAGLNLTATNFIYTINSQTGTTYTPASNDAWSIVTLNNSSVISVTIPTNASVAYSVGTQLNFVWITGAGQPTISAVTPGTTTIISTGATSASPKLRAVNSMATCIKIATDVWLVSGDVA